MADVDIDQKIVFGISHEVGEIPTLVMGIPTAAWEYMKDGHTHTFDLSKAGIPVKVVLFGASDHDAVLALIDAGLKASGHPYLDERRKDFSIE